MLVICKTWTFAAAHHLPNLPAGHQCRRVHGHNYRVELMLAMRGVPSDGMVYDFGRLKPFIDLINATFDHQDLNDTLDIPTAENIAAYIGSAAIGSLNLPSGVVLDAVRVWETDTCWAEWKPEQQR
jgi:6-pyruvoyltetrahydropterin/6-carboxytetrahydropterin synthase